MVHPTLTKRHELRLGRAYSEHQVEEEGIGTTVCKLEDRKSDVGTGSVRGDGEDGPGLLLWCSGKPPPFESEAFCPHADGDAPSYLEHTKELLGIVHPVKGLLIVFSLIPKELYPLLFRIGGSGQGRGVRT